METLGLFYPLAITPSGDIQLASTLTEDLVQSYARYLIDTGEAGFSPFEAVGSEVTAVELERFSFALRTKCPRIQFDIKSRWEGRVFLIDIGWNDVTTTVEVPFG